MFERIAFSVVALLVAAGPARAQEEPLQPIRGYAGGGLIGAQPVGEFSRFIDRGFGAGGHFVWNLDRSGALGVRVDGGFINYGRERQRVCLSTTVGCRIQVDLTTTNDIAYGSIGPQITLPHGPVQPYVNASVGFSYFSTSSSVEGVDDNDDEFNTTNFDDLTFAWHAGAGLRIPVSMARMPVFIDVGARYNTNGSVEYLREGDIIDHPDGSITLTPQRSDADLVTYVLGVSIGIR